MAKSKLAIAVASKIGKIFGAADGEQGSASATEAVARALAAASPDTIIIVDNAGVIASSIVRLGNVARASFSEKFAPGKNIFELQGERIDNLRQVLSAVDSGENCRVTEFSLADDEGCVVWVEARV
jgi:hypothetical protein